MAKCPDCNAPLPAGQWQCTQCGTSRAKPALPAAAMAYRCCFEADGRCQGKAIRVNDSWLCNGHYEHFCDRQLRAGEPITTTGLLFKIKLDEINASVAKHRSTHPGTANIDACLAYVREHGLATALTHAAPKLMPDDEARAEREAIQNEEHAP